MTHDLLNTPEDEDSKRSKEFPLYPRLSEDGVKEALVLVEGFKKQLIKAADDAISELYVDLPDYIEGDSWENFRNSLLAALSDYGNRKIQGAHDFAKIRRSIYEKYKDEIIVDLNQDLVEENARLTKQLAQEREYARSRLY
jgi:hypothetical protein